jgi:hypothetical protein
VAWLRGRKIARLAREVNLILVPIPRPRVQSADDFYLDKGSAAQVSLPP